jgi:polyisoprenoid-binding protein YceI
VTNSVDAVGMSLAHFVIDGRASRFTVQAFASGMLSVVGHNPTMAIGKFSGEVDFSSESLEARGLRLLIEAGSLNVQDDISDRDRREIERITNEQVLEIKQYPEIVYESPVASITRLGESLYSAALNGTLSFHGVIRNQPVTARIAVFGEMLRVSGDFTLRQSDYQIKPVVVAGGALKLKDELKFSFEIVARLKE